MPKIKRLKNKKIKR